MALKKATKLKSKQKLPEGRRKTVHSVTKTQRPAVQPDAASRKLASGLVKQAEARRLASRSEREAQIGLADLDEAAELADISQNIGELSDAARALSLEENDRAMELAATAGQIDTVGDALRATGMNSVGTFLNEMGRRLREMAVRDMLRAQDTSGLARAIGETGEGIERIGEEEVAAGAVELASAETDGDISRLSATTTDDQIAESLMGSVKPV